MKKYFSLASALMLALSMGMTSCSNDLDEVQAPAEQQPEMHKLYLNATAPNTPETRAYVEGTADSDAITITGWKNGDKIYGIYQTNATASGKYLNGNPASVEFTFKSSSNEFESELVPASITSDQIKYFIHGGDGTLGGDMYFRVNTQTGSVTSRFQFIPSNFAQTVDVEGHFTDIMMISVASVDGEGKLAADMQLPKYMAFICLHNDSDSPITAKLMEEGDTYITKSCLDISTSIYQYSINRSTDSSLALTAPIPAHAKAYLPIKSVNNYTYMVEVNGIARATKTADFAAGKVYKLTYPSSAFVAE